MILHVLYRFLIGAFALLLLGLQNLNANHGGGNNGMDIKLWLFLSLAILIFEGLFLVGEMCFLFYKGTYRLAVADLALLILGIITFIVLASV